MPNYLAIDWEKDQLYGLEADVSAGAVRLVRSFDLQWPDEVLSANDPSAAGKWLGSKLQEHGISAAQVLVTLPREDAVVRHLELPPSPADELPDLVRFQASIKSTRPLDELLLDYVPLYNEVAGETKDVLMTTVAKEQTDFITKTLESAGLSLTSIGLAPIAAAELVARVEEQQAVNPNETSLLVCAHGDRVEISAIKRRNLLFTHSTRLMSTNDASQHIQVILAEISRSFVALQKTLPDVSIVRGWIIAAPDEASTLAERLQERLSISTVSVPECQVKVIDPLNLSNATNAPIDVGGSHAPYVGPSGILMWASGGRTEFVDFLNPRKRPEVRDTRKYKVVAIAAAAVLVLGTGFTFRQMTINELESSYRSISGEVRDKKKELEPLLERVDKADTVQSWVDRRINWLEQTDELITSIDGTENYFLNDLRLTTGGSGKLKGRIGGTGSAKSDAHVYALNTTLDGNTNTISDSKDAEYKRSFKLDVELKKEELEEEESDKK